MKETIMYCGKDSVGNFVHFYSNEFGVTFSGHKEIFKVKISECENNKKKTHWSWWDNADKSFKYTHYEKSGVEMCFPYSISIFEENNEGKLLPVIVELV